MRLKFTLFTNGMGKNNKIDYLRSLNSTKDRKRDMNNKFHTDEFQLEAYHR